MKEAETLSNLFHKRGTREVLQKADRLAVLNFNDVYIIDLGFVSSRLAGSSSKARRRYIHTRGELLNVDTIAGSDMRRNDIVFEMLSDVVLYKLPMDVLLHEMETNASLAMDMVRRVVRQNGYIKQRVENLSYTFASDKLIYRLLCVAQRFGQRRGTSIVVTKPVSHREIASFTNLTRESVTREMNKLVERGLVSYEKEVVTIHDPAGLVNALYQPVRTDWSGLLGR